jgi:hypothetical protein
MRSENDLQGLRGSLGNMIYREKISINSGLKQISNGDQFVNI